MNHKIPLDHLTKGGLIRQLSDVISGAEGEDEDQNDDNNSENESEEDDDSSDEDDDSENDDEDDDEDDEDDDSKPDITGLKKALAAERAARKAADKKAAKLEAAETARNRAKLGAVEKAQAELKDAKAKADKLASGLLLRDQNDVIKKYAEKHNFIDTADAIDSIPRSKIVFTQDKDDPTDITIDESSVEKLIKALAAKKPHFIKSGTTDGQETGGQFGGSNRNKKQTTEESLKGIYPGL